MSAIAALRERDPALEEDFASLLDETLGRDSGFDGSVVSGRVLRVTDDSVIVDVGLKSEGRVPLKEFGPPGQKPEVAEGDVVELYVERYEDRDGTIVLSREKARREEAWSNLERPMPRTSASTARSTAGSRAASPSISAAPWPSCRAARSISARSATSARSWARPSPSRSSRWTALAGISSVSRRAVLEETRAEQRSELIQGLKEGMILDGVVKNITDYGAFVDLGGVDGLLHVTDIAWRRINHPSEALQIGQPVKVQVIRFNQETQRISLGMKQLEVDPWEGVAAKYPAGRQVRGPGHQHHRLRRLRGAGGRGRGPGACFRNVLDEEERPSGKIVATSQEVDVLVLDVDAGKRRISLGLKQVQRNPWEQFVDEHPIGSEVEGEIRNITEFGLFIGITADIDGMVHMSDLSWDEQGEQAIAHFEKGQVIKAKVLDVDVEKERISLGIKQLRDDPAAGIFDRVHKGDIVTCVVTAVQANGIEVQVDDLLTGFIRRAELARDKGDQRPDRFAVGEKVDAKIVSIDRAARKLALTIRARRWMRTSRRCRNTAAWTRVRLWATSWAPRSAAVTSRAKTAKPQTARSGLPQRWGRPLCVVVWCVRGRCALAGGVRFNPPLVHARAGLTVQAQPRHQARRPLSPPCKGGAGGGPGRVAIGVPFGARTNPPQPLPRREGEESFAPRATRPRRCRLGNPRAAHFQTASNALPPACLAQTALPVSWRARATRRPIV